MASSFKGFAAGADRLTTREVLTPPAAVKNPPVAPLEAAPAEITEQITRPRGRPSVGKRSNTQFRQVTAYIRSETYEESRRKLDYQGGRKQDFSDLVQELLEKWLKQQK